MSAAFPLLSGTLSVNKRYIWSFLSCRFGNFISQMLDFQEQKNEIGDVIMQMSSPLCPISHYAVTNTYKNNHSSSIMTYTCESKFRILLVIRTFFHCFLLHRSITTANIVKMKPTLHTPYIGNYNMTSFFRFANKRAIYRLGILSSAYAPVHLSDFSFNSCVTYCCTDGRMTFVGP